MKAISVKQPFASQILLGLKKIETRTWPTKYRGQLLICASKKLHDGVSIIDGISMWSQELPRKHPETYPTGVMICTANLIDCRPMLIDDEKAACCEWYYGAWAWILNDIKPVENKPVKGMLGLFTVPDESIRLWKKIAEDTVH